MSTDAIYPISAPAGCPSYVVTSVQDRCNGALRAALDPSNKSVDIRGRYHQRLDEEVRMLRRVADGEKPNGVPVDQDWWVRWGMRTVTEAWANAATLAAFREALSSPSYDHLTSGHPVCPNSYHVYAHDATSPTGCHQVASAPHNLPGVDAVLAASRRSACQGAQRGSR